LAIFARCTIYWTTCIAADPDLVLTHSFSIGWKNRTKIEKRHKSGNETIAR
jgi:hypothetical protein